MRTKHYARYIGTCPKGYGCKSCGPHSLRKVDSRRKVRRKDKQNLKAKVES